MLTGPLRPGQLFCPAGPKLRCHQFVRIEHEFLGGPFIKIDVTFGRLVEGYDRYVHCFRDLDFIMEDRLHELTVVLEDRGLPGLESVAFCPAQT